VTTTPRRKKGILTSALFLLGTFLLFLPSASAEGLESGVVPMPVFIVVAALASLFITLGLAISAPWVVILGSVASFILGFILEAGNLGIRLTQDAPYTAWSGPNHHLLGFMVMLFGVVFFTMALLNLGGSDDGFR
jgi:hypothetical protein